MAKVYTGTANVKTLNVTVAQPIDARMVVQYFSDLYDYSTFGTSYYVGMFVFVLETKEMYILKSAPTGASAKRNWTTQAIWEKVDKNVYNVATIANLADGTIKFPYKGLLAYVDEDNGLYALTTDDGSVVENWKKVGGESKGFAFDPDGEIASSDVPEGLSITNEDNAPVAYIKMGDTTERLLVESDITNMGDTIMINVGDSDSDRISVQEVINNILDAAPIPNADIEGLFTE